ncbi:MAG TPA: hypothetical protein VGO92_02750 [Acidimicrobiales bacterium]|nr:hypothetical protein [Acidimicrobiales bacterium]
MPYTVAAALAADHRATLMREARIFRLARFVNRCCRTALGCS